MDIIFRPARAEDAPQLGSVHSTAWKETYTGLLPSRLIQEKTAEKCAAVFAAQHCRNIAVAISAKHIIGFCGYGKPRDNLIPQNQGEIYGLYVLKEFHRHKIGTELLRMAERNLITEGCQYVYLWVLTSNINAKDFYRLFGFRHTGIEKKIGDTQLIEELLVHQLFS